MIKSNRKRNNATRRRHQRAWLFLSFPSFGYRGRPDGRRTHDDAYWKGCTINRFTMRFEWRADVRSLGADDPPRKCSKTENKNQSEMSRRACAPHVIANCVLHGTLYTYGATGLGTSSTTKRKCTALLHNRCRVAYDRVHRCTLTKYSRLFPVKGRRDIGASGGS